jgi:SPP1 gp7 family putative phage head morphogenesis protein
VPKPKLSNTQIRAIVSRVDARELIKRGQVVIRATVDTFGKRAASQLHLPDQFNLQDPRVGRFLRQWGVERITTKVNRVTQERLRVVLERGSDAGKPYAEIEKDIARVFEVAKGSRARAIAQTEIPRASNFASKESYRQLGVEKKEWQATEDDVTRDTHAEMNGQVVEINEMFVSPSGAQADYPGDFGVPEEDINCRCGVLPVVEEQRMIGNRFHMWKMLERQRLPFERRLRVAMKSGFAAQERAALEQFRQYVVLEDAA